MVSALWKACSEGDLDQVHGLLAEASSVDVEIKDHTGVTPLIEAVKNGHIEVVRALLDKGADPTNASSQGPPEQYTSDPAILELLNAAKSRLNNPNGIMQETAYVQDPNLDPSKAYYPPPGAYYYPGMPLPPHVLPDGTVGYYAPPPLMPADANAAGYPNLPPPDVARMIPCRYYPACRYGSSCMFAHPQTPYLQGPLPPPAQYPAPYDPMTAPPYPPSGYYAVPPPSFQPPPNGAAMPMSPQSPSHHARSGSEILSPVQGPFSPSPLPPSIPYGVSPVSPTFGHPTQAPAPIAIPPHPAGIPQSPQQPMYPPTSPIAANGVPPYGYTHENPGVFVPQGIHPNGIQETLVSPKSPRHPQADGYGPGPINREPMTHHRRGSARRPSFGGGLGRKPPCLFFPSGRCRNGDECRFPHVLPDGPVLNHQPHFAPRGGHRPRPSFHANNVNAIEEKLSSMTVQDDRNSTLSRNGASATTNSSRSHSTDSGNKARFPQNFRNGPAPNGARHEKKLPPSKPQRVPNAEEFPVLTSTTPPLRSPAINGSSVYSGPTAAQVLQAPPPVRKETQPPARNAASEPSQSEKSEKETKADQPATSSGTQPQEQAPSNIPVSFAAIAAAAPEAAKEVSVTA